MAGQVFGGHQPGISAAIAATVLLTGVLVTGLVLSGGGPAGSGDGPQAPGSGDGTSQVMQRPADAVQHSADQSGRLDHLPQHLVRRVYHDLHGVRVPGWDPERKRGLCSRWNRKRHDQSVSTGYRALLGPGGECSP